MNGVVRSVKIGPSFFAGAFNDYSDWVRAMAREAMQNCIDAPRSNKIEVETSHDGNNTILVFRNNGLPMSEDVLLNKFLALGESGKRFNGTVGGFGKAKELLCFCHKAWEIRTGNLFASGAGGDYSLEEIPYFNGTETKVTIEGYRNHDLANAFRDFASLAKWNGTFILNGEVLETNLNKGSRRMELDFGVIYTNNSFPGTMVVRIGGIPMFSRPIRTKGMVLVELNGESSSVLASNRDSLKWNAQSKLDSFVNELAVNTRSALKDKAKKPVLVKFPGFKLRGSFEDEGVVESRVGESIKMDIKAPVVATLVANNRAAAARSASGEATITEEEIEGVLHPEFFMKSEVEGTIPKRFNPSSFSPNSRKLISRWIGLLVEMASVTKFAGTFSVGFIFDEDCLAQYEKEGDRNVLYINPAKIIKEEGKPRKFVSRWEFDPAGNWELLATVTHEFVHLMGYSLHDEDYAGRFTDLMSLVLNNRARFSKHFKMPDCWPA